MRLGWIALFIALSGAAYADETDARAIMRQSAIDQAETTPATVPSAEASATARTRADGQQAQSERATHAASASAAARHAAVSAARAAAAADSAAPLTGTPSPARNATIRDSAADAAHRGVSGVAQEHTVRTGGGHSGPAGGRP